jgi:hypothetical protein
MTVHTLVEYAKTYGGSEAEKAIIEMFPEELDFLQRDAVQDRSRRQVRLHARR